MKAITAALILFAAVSSNAGYTTGFEWLDGVDASDVGVAISGQAGWYQPVEGSAEGFAHIYSGNPFNTLANPLGGQQYLVCASDENKPQIVCRAQHDVDFSSNEWTLTYDWAAQWQGQLPASDFIGSVSLQPSQSANGFQTALRWDDVNSPNSYSALYGIADSIGLPIGQSISNFVSPGPAWEHLQTNVWYRSTTTWNFLTGQITRVSIRNLTTGSMTTTATPAGWYLSGGVNNFQGRAFPTALRLFAGGSSTGNVVSYDNINTYPVSVDATLSPVKELIVLGKGEEGSLSSYDKLDGDSRLICKLFVPAMPIAFVRVDLDFQVPTSHLQALRFLVGIGTSTPGPQSIDLYLQDRVTSFWTKTTVFRQAVRNGGLYEGMATDPLARYVDSNGILKARIEIWQRGPSTSFFPCCSFDSANLIIQG